MNPTGPSFHLVLEPPASAAQPPDGPPRIEIPESAGFLESTRDGIALRPTTVPRTDARRDAGDEHAPLLVQPVREGRFPLLLLLVPGGRRVTVNGAPAPPVSLLEEGDELLLDDAPPSVAHVVLFHRVAVGPPGAEEIGATCPVCLVPIAPDTRLYRCFHCGKPLHLEPADRAGREPLECARICTECPSCHTPIRMETGYGRLPEFCRDGLPPPAPRPGEME